MSESKRHSSKRRLGKLKGSNARAKSLTEERRGEIARAAAQGQSSLLVTSKDPGHCPGNRRPDAAKTGEVAISRGKRASFFLATALLLVVFAEGLFAIALRIGEGQWPYSRPKSANYLLFEAHPEWVLTPRKGVTVTVLGNSHHHNTDGFRGNEFSRVKTKRRIACIGGSTTYCIGVGDDQTWPFYLDQLLQPDYEVLNFGIPGHSSVEHRKLLPQILARYSPDIVVFQMGLNDLRNMNFDDPGPDYANFHQPSLLFNVSGACRRDRLPRCALLQGAVVLLEKIKVLSRNDVVAKAVTVGKDLWAYDKAHQANRRIGSPNSDRVH